MPKPEWLVTIIYEDASAEDFHVSGHYKAAGAIQQAALSVTVDKYELHGDKIMQIIAQREAD